MRKDAEPAKGVGVSKGVPPNRVHDCRPTTPVSSFAGTPEGVAEFAGAGAGAAVPAALIGVNVGLGGREMSCGLLARSPDAENDMLEGSVKNAPGIDVSMGCSMGGWLPPRLELPTLDDVSSGSCSPSVSVSDSSSSSTTSCVSSPLLSAEPSSLPPPLPRPELP